MKQQKSTPTVLKCSKDADLLAALPIMMGYTIADSLAAVLFNGKRSLGVMRMDLPEESDHQTAKSSIEVLRKNVAAIPGVTGVGLVIYHSEVKTDLKRNLPYRSFIDAAAEALDKSGLKVQARLYVGRSYWSNYETQPNMFEQRSLNEIYDSSFALEARLSLEKPLSALEEMHNLSDSVNGEPQNLSTVQKTGVFDTETIEAIEITHEYLVSQAELVQNFLYEKSPNQSKLNTTKMIINLANPTLWLVTAATLTLGSKTPAYFFEGLSEKQLDKLRSFSDKSRRRAEDLFFFLRAFSSNKLETQKVEKVHQNLHALALQTFTENRSEIVALHAWLWWMMGLSTPARNLISEHSASQETERIVQLEAVTKLIESGPPLWIFADQTSRVA